jgi:TRAP-type C4-dicarboxylate transport system substrate-binding protein
MRLVRLIACLVVVAATTVACHSSTDKAGGSHEAPVVLALASVGGLPPTPVLTWIAAVERRSRGSIRIDTQQPWRYADSYAELHTLRDLRSGRIQLAWLGARVFDRAGTRNFEPLLAPLLVDSYELEVRALQDAVVQRTMAGAAVPGVRVLGVLPGPMRRMAGFSRAFRQAGDFRGQVVGLADSALATETLRALGARPRPTAAAMPIHGLDGYEQHLASIAGNGYDRVAGYVTPNLNLWPRVIVLAAGDAALARLSRSQRAALQGAAAEVFPAATREASAEDATAMNAICGARMRVVTATAAQIAGMRAAVAPVYRALAADAVTRAAVTRIQQLKRSLHASPSVPPLCGAFSARRAGTGGTPADGSYAVKIAPADLPSADRLAEAYGSWELVLDAGRFRFTQRSDGADWIADGTMRVSGDTMTWTASHVLDKGPHGAPDGVPMQAGDVLRFRWRRHGTEIVLHSLDAHPLVPAFGIRPLRRTGDAPGQEGAVDPSPLFGTWKATSTAQDVLAHHDDANGISDNTGPMTLTIGRSACSWKQQAPDGPHFARGSCRFSGDTLELDWTTLDPRTAAAPYFFHWSVFENRLTLRNAPGFSPEWTYHAWRRSS